MSKLQPRIALFESNRKNSNQQNNRQTPSKNLNDFGNKTTTTDDNDNKKGEEVGIEKTKFQKLFEFFNERAIRHKKKNNSKRSRKKGISENKLLGKSKNIEQEKAKIAIEKTVNKRDEKDKNILGKNENETSGKSEDILKKDVSKIGEEMIKESNSEKIKNEQPAPNPKSNVIKINEKQNNSKENLLIITKNNLKKLPESNLNELDKLRKSFSENIINKKDEKPLINQRRSEKAPKTPSENIINKNDEDTKNSLRDSINSIDDEPKVTKESSLKKTDEQINNYYEFESISKFLTSFKPFYTIKVDFEKNYIEFLILLYDKVSDPSKINASIQKKETGYYINVNGETNNIDNELDIEECTIECGNFQIEEEIITHTDLKDGWVVHKNIDNEGKAIISFSIDN